MLLRADPTSAVPIHQQLAGQLRAAIADGDPGPGEKLPPARTLADALGVNVHTVLRAIATLRDEGLLDVRRGRGTVVTDRAPDVAAPSELARTYVDGARALGMTDADIRHLVEVHL